MPPHETEARESEEKVRSLLKLAKPPVRYDPSTLLNLTKLNLPECGLSSLPSNLGEVLPNLGILFCPKNDFAEVPAVIGSCKQLQMVSFKSNKALVRIHPDALQPQLRWLILTDNCIETLPKSIGRCNKLQKLMLSGNRIKEIPSEISGCQNLELVRLASNLLSEPPMALLQLPNLAWIGLSANPFLAHVVEDSATIASDANLQVITDYQKGELLGQGASGITHQATLSDGKEVAIKTYFGTMTSDGHPQEERRLSFTASMLQCSSLIHVLGQTGEGNLVMDLLRDVRALANPPSMETCSRDVYDEDASLSPTLARMIVTSLLEALLKLHSVGICHGDFYGHNILLCQHDTEAKLSDFGAAFAYNSTTSEYGKCIERIEMRAFGILVEEVSMMVKKGHGVTSVDGESIEKLCTTLDELSRGAREATTFSELQTVWSKE